MIQKTKDYYMFHLLSDNRFKLHRNHVEHLKRSILEKNMLALRPITVNSKYEIMDGQHRYLAAKELGLEIYYEIHLDNEMNDMVKLNINKAWNLMDYQNYYTKNGYKQYILLAEYMKENNVSISLALKLEYHSSRKLNKLFKSGQYIFNLTEKGISLKICNTILDFLQDKLPIKAYITSNKFKIALIKLINNENFSLQIFMKNLEKHIDKIGPRIDYLSYYHLFQGIYNYRLKTKLTEEKMNKEDLKNP